MNACAGRAFLGLRINQMNVNGYRLKRMLRSLERRRGYLKNRWSDSLWAFPGEEKPNPEALLDELREVEFNLAQVQTAQARYNLEIEVDVKHGGERERMSLLEAIKRVGGASRLEQMAKAASSSEEQYYYGHSPHTRSTEAEHATRQLAPERAAERMDQLGEYAEALREAIAIGNETTIDIDGLDSSLSE